MSNTSEALTDDHLHLLRHMLGINTPWDKVPKPYRNYGAFPPGNEKMAELERLGMVEKTREAGEAVKYDYWACTDKGKAAAMKSHRDIRYSKGKRKYHRFLDLRDCFPDLTFKRFLTDPFFADDRKAA